MNKKFNDILNNFKEKSYALLNKNTERTPTPKDTTEMLKDSAKEDTNKIDIFKTLIITLMIVSLFVFVWLSRGGYFQNNTTLVDNSTCVTPNLSCPVIPACPSCNCPNPIIHVNYTIINNVTNST